MQKWESVIFSCVGNRKSEVRSKKWEVGNQKSEIGIWKWEVGRGKWEVRRSSHSASSLNGQKSEIRSSHFVKYEVLSLKSEVRTEVGRPSSAFV